LNAEQRSQASLSFCWGVALEARDELERHDDDDDDDDDDAADDADDGSIAETSVSVGAVAKPDRTHGDRGGGRGRVAHSVKPKRRWGSASMTNK
jgi:hypothetical protein